jgi:hypothetical protein
MKCQNCSHINFGNAAFCSKCGAPLSKGTMPVYNYQTSQYSINKKSSLGAISLIFGIISIIPCCVFYHYVPALIAIITGIIELKRISRGESPAKNRSMAITGLIFGIIALFVSLIIFAFSFLSKGGYKYPTYDV